MDCNIENKHIECGKYTVGMQSCRLVANFTVRPPDFAMHEAAGYAVCKPTIGLLRRPIGVYCTVTLSETRRDYVVPYANISLVLKHTPAYIGGGRGECVNNDGVGGGGGGGHVTNSAFHTDHLVLLSPFITYTHPK